MTEKTIATSSILITGANRGIGLGLVREALSAHPEMTVYATAREPALAGELQMLVEQYARLFVLRLDKIDEESVQNAALKLGEYTDRLDAAIFNAGISVGHTSLYNLSSTDLLNNLNVNIVGNHNLFKALTPFFLQGGVEKKVIGVISSIGSSIKLAPMTIPFLKEAYELDYSCIAGYCVSKSGLNMLARQWGESLPQDISVLVIHPGSVATETNHGDDLISREESAKGIFGLLQSIRHEDVRKGMHSYEGQIFPW